VNDQTVHDTSDFTHAFRSHASGVVDIAIIREKREQKLKLTLPERKDTGDVFEEESFDVPDMDAIAGVAMTEVQSEIARLRPEMERAARDLTLQMAEIERLGPAAQNVSREIQRAAEDAQKQLCSHRNELKKSQEAMRQHSRELRQQLLEQQRQLREHQRRLQQQLRHELKGDWLEI
jgi:chromosome segregation ATPase